MAIEFQCPRCEATIRVPDSASGTAGNCPKCQVRLRVPAVVVAPAFPKRPYRSRSPESAPPPSAGDAPATFEFSCPLCTAPVLVPVAAAGRNGKCPHCSGRIRVPTPGEGVHPPANLTFEELFGGGGQSAETPATPGFPGGAGFSMENFSPVGKGGEQSVSAGSSAKSTDDPAPGRHFAALRRKGSRLWKILIPVAAFTLALGMWGAWELLQKMRLKGELPGIIATEKHLPAVEVEQVFADLSDLRPLEVALTKQPLHWDSPLVAMNVSAAHGCLQIDIRAGGEAALYRVQPEGLPVFSQYARRHAELFERQRRADLQGECPKLISKLKELLLNSGANMEGLENFRDSVGLAAAVRGAGYHLVAVHENEPHRCVYEDAEGNLYFLLPKGLTHFELRGRQDLTKGHAGFPGVFQVSIGAEGKRQAPASETTGEGTARPSSAEDLDIEKTPPPSKREAEPPVTTSEGAPPPARKEPLLKD